jgi:hypothetical protein
VEHIGTNGVTDMFLPRNWTLDWLTTHCQARFGVTPQPRLLADTWGFDDLQRLGTTHIVFTVCGHHWGLIVGHFITSLEMNSHMVMMGFFCGLRDWFSVWDHRMA